jgi:glycosyltransferase involved in cell wall biosynthesis
MKLSKERLKLNNNRKFKFLNISIPHHRKNIDLLIEAYYSAFKKEDDVSLIIKTSLAKPKTEFECNFIEILKEAQKKFGSNVPQIEVITDQIDDMSKLYNSCDSIVSASSSEGFGLPLLEGLLFEKIVIAPNCTGQLDFLNKDNSILVDVKEVPAGKKYQYWRPSSGAKTYMPSADSIAESMLKAYKGNVSFKENLHSISDFVATNYTWKHSSDRILELLK